MRILIVSQYYPPEAVPLPADLARGLAARGHQVRVLTGYPNYPSGKVFPGFKQRWRSVEKDGSVEVRRVPLFADHSQSAVKRLLNYVSFAVSASTARKAARGADVVYVYATQMTAALGPWIWRLTGGAPYVLHVQDLWPDSIVGSSLVIGGARAKLITTILAPWLRWVYRQAGAVIGIAPTMVTTLAARGARSDAVHLVYNWADDMEPVESALPKPEGEARAEVVYAGNVGDMQDLGTAVRAAHASADAGVALTIVGDGLARSALRDLVADLGATNVRFQEPVPRDQMRDVYSRADFALVSLKDMPVFRGTIPSKFQSVLAAGIPVITTVQGDVRSFVEENELGLTANAQNVDSLETAFRAAAQVPSPDRESMSERARAAYEAHFSRESGLSEIEGLLSEAARKRKRGR